MAFATGGVITLTADLPAIIDYITVDASTAPTPVSIDGADTWQPFVVDFVGYLELKGLTITNGATTGSGGALDNFGFAILTDVTISSSTADASGGGISARAESFTGLDGVTITGNSTNGSGGGLDIVGFAILIDVEVSSNTAVDAGGGAVARSAEGVIFYNSTINANQATGAHADGGGIENEGWLGLLNVTITGNSATSGGGINDTDSVDIINATITGNTAASGSGMKSNSAPIVTGAIVLGNTGSDPEIDATLDVTSTHNLTALPGGVTLAQVLDPAGLADNGGPTETIALVRDALNPAWGGGDPVMCADFRFDQRMYPRTSPCDIGAYEIDDAAPAMVAPVISLVPGGRLSGTASAGKVAWSATDAGSGVAGYELEASRNGAGYLPVSMSPMATSTLPRFANGSSYRFRARAVDGDGNWSGWTYSPTITARLLQQTASGITYSSGWRAESRSAYSGGSAKYAKAKGTWVKLVATGRVFSFVTTKALSRGKAKVFVDGAYVATIDLRASTTAYRVQAWTRSYSTSKQRTIKILLLGTSGRPRVDADAFIVLK